MREIINPNDGREVGVVLDKPNEIEAFQLLAIRGRLELEIKGLRFKGRSTAAVVRERFNIRERTRAGVLRAFESQLRERGILK